MMGFDPVWLAILIAINLQTSFLTPPFGFSLFYLRGVANKSIETKQIYRGVVPFIFIQLLVLVAVLIMPILVL
jgi:TRAP-type mannitol/chloroaromatic compound transport system permease large subunit